jgi:hypothetical protein
MGKNTFFTRLKIVSQQINSFFKMQRFGLHKKNISASFGSTLDNLIDLRQMRA